MRTRRSTALLGALAGVALLAGCSTSPAGSRAEPADQPAPSAASSTPTPVLTGAPLTAVAIGDSLSRGFDACAQYGDCPSVSWSTGTDSRVDSVADRLSAATGSPVRRVNDARSGVTSEDLARQAAAAVAQRPDLVTVLIGANDVCRADVADMTPTSDYALRVASALGTLASEAPDAVVLVASVPDPTALLDAAGTDPTAQFLWSRVGGCATALRDPQSSSPDAEDRREQVRQRVAEYDAVLQAACASHPRCVYDGGALTAYRPTKAQLSALDSFHPSIAGLKALAALEWKPLAASGLLPS